MGQEPEPQRNPLCISNRQPQCNPLVKRDSIKGIGQICRYNRPQCQYRRFTQHYCRIGLTQRNSNYFTQRNYKCFA